MAFDGIVTKAITNELLELIDSRVDKIFEPNKNEILLGLYKSGKNYLLNVSIDSQNYRINLTTHTRQNPMQAQNFCMLLRKNLIGLHLKNIITFGLERVIVIEFEGFDEIDDIISKKLVIELMGKHSNIILLDSENIIIDSMRHIKEVDENYRDILPHTKYSLPTTEKLSFLDIKNHESFIDSLEKFNNININEINIDDLPNLISNTFNGISKSFVSQTIISLNNENKNKEIINEYLNSIYDYINDIIKNLDKLTFEYIYKNDVIKDYYLKKIDNNKNSNFNLNFFIDDFYYSRETSEEFKNYRNALLKLILEILKKYNKRLENIDEKLEECKDLEKYRIYGELITSNLYKIPNKNIESIEVENYYDNNNLINIQLDKKYLPSINAKRYYKKYSKLKNALEVCTQQKKDTIQDLNYIESIVYELESATNVEQLYSILDEISDNSIFKEKLEKSTLSKKESKIKKSKLTKNKDSKFNPIKYIIDGYTIYVGRNNKENDYLTLKFANKSDLWFHVKDFHGSHVILKIENINQTPSEELLMKIAKIAVLHSKAKNSSNVPVDYCEVKNVKRISASKPGLVYYRNNKTIYVKNK